MTKKREKLKIATDVSEKELKLIDKACEIENRSRANFIRKACLDESSKIVNKGDMR